MNASGSRAPFARFDAEECVKFGLPLAQQRLGHNEKHPTHALRHQLRNDQARLDGLAEPHLVGKDAPPFRDTSQREHDCIDLMWIRIDAALALARGIAPLLVGASNAHQIFGKQPALNRAESGSHSARNTFITSSSSLAAPP